MGYAGRLDPMAQGVLVVLCSDLSSKQVEYSNLDKEYVADIIFGFETDTFDMLGVASNYTQKKVLKLKIEESLKSFKGDFSFKLPQYSSYIIKGKPLYWWARNKKMSEVNIPTKKVKLYDIKLESMHQINLKDFQDNINTRINSVNGDFRQDDIIKKWNKVFTGLDEQVFQYAKIRIKCSSGTYVRSIAHMLGKQLNTSACLFNLTRTKVGKYDIKDSIKI